MNEVIWHEVECAAYAADLPLWEELAAERAGPVLDLGCGTGRVTSHLARLGHEVLGLDLDPRLIADLAEAEAGDARDFELGRHFALVLAPMQVIQLLADQRERLACLRCVSAHLTPGGIAAFAIVEGMPEPTHARPPLPDTREVDEWVYSSQPIETLVDADCIRARRLRQAVSPSGDLSEEISEDLLRTLTASALEEEAAQMGLQPAGRRAIGPTEDHVGSTVVLLEKGT
jgi:SAM-dependent methyltransferase